MAVLFSNVKAIEPKPLASSWDQLRELLSMIHIYDTKRQTNQSGNRY